MIRDCLKLVACAFLGLVALGPFTAFGETPAKKAPTYVIKGDYFEGCECSSICPCIWSKDATQEQCRGVVTYQIREGHYGSTDLKGTTFAASIVKSGKNLEKAAGTWEGVLYVPQSATQAQREAIEAIVRKEMGSAYAKLVAKSVPIDVKGAAGHEDLTIGSMAHLKIAPIMGANGKVIRIDNPPSPLANPINYVAKAEVHTYRDAGAEWDFGGRNSFYGPFEMKTH